MANTRNTKLRALLGKILSGKEEVSQHNALLFLEAICEQPEPALCIQRLVGSRHGYRALQSSLSSDISATALNGPISTFLIYLQAPTLKTICGGEVLRQVILKVVETPLTWDSFVEVARSKRLDDHGLEAFSWLLLQLLSLPTELAITFAAIGKDEDIRKDLLESSQTAVRLRAQRIVHITNTITAEYTPDPRGPGGRHDNDFADIRKISILPTSDELAASDNDPFLPRVSEIETSLRLPDGLAFHVDCQFRLLREDMLRDLREEIQVALMIKKGRRRGLCIENLSMVGVECDLRQPWSLRLQCLEDLPQLSGKNGPARKKFIQENVKFLKHESLACLVADDDVVTLGTLIRDEDLLSQKPSTICLQIPNAATEKALLRIKTSKNVKVIQLSTALFAYESVLKQLKEIKELSLEEDILRWEQGKPLQLPSYQITGDIRNLMQELEKDNTRSLKRILRLPMETRLDKSQAACFLAGLHQRVTLIQGPPGTGKSFIGSLIAKAIHRFSTEKILVVCYTHHALDQFLEEILNLGVPEHDIVRMGATKKATARTLPLSINNARRNVGLTREQHEILNLRKLDSCESSDNLRDAFINFQQSTFSKGEILEYLEFLSEGPPFFSAFQVPEARCDMNRVGKRSKSVDRFYLLDRWYRGKDAGIFQKLLGPQFPDVWEISGLNRIKLFNEWKEAMLRERLTLVRDAGKSYNASLEQMNAISTEKDLAVIRQKRIIACTTTGAAKHVRMLQCISPGVLLVEEAGEILESHILTALGPETKQMILIGDHKQLRPKVHYDLSVERGHGYDLNRSLFERLILRGYPHETLLEQHRMRPELSALVRHLTYPDLIDAPKTRKNPKIRGFSDNLIFVNHKEHEIDMTNVPDWRDTTSTSSKKNLFEAKMTLKCVRYLGQQGYKTDNIAVLTPYLGQLRLLLDELGSENDPVLNDLDSYDLVRAGLMPAASASLGKPQIRISTVDNFQGDESDIIIISLTRSNARGDIGFLSAPERLNVLLSRARNALILIGNAETFIGSRKGGDLWKRLMDMLKAGNHVYDGFPIKCERHSNRTAILRRPEDFDKECPDGGCMEPCGVMLNCGRHKCPQHCHQPYDHSKIQCQSFVELKCSENHLQRRKCHKLQPINCRQCERAEERKRKKLEMDLEMQNKQEKAQVQNAADTDNKQDKPKVQNAADTGKQDKTRAKNTADTGKENKPQVQNGADTDKQDKTQTQNAAALEELERQLQVSREQVPDSSAAMERAYALEQKKRELTTAEKQWQGNLKENNSIRTLPGLPSLDKNETLTLQRSTNEGQIGISHLNPRQVKPSKECELVTVGIGPSEAEWERQKRMDNASNDAIDSLMKLTGLEEVKAKVLSIKAKKETGEWTDMKKERLGMMMLGNPGTGKTTVARLYAQFLASINVLPGNEFEEITGSDLANEGVAGTKQRIEAMLDEGGGTFFLDEASQLNSCGGKAMLNFLLAEMEERAGNIVFLLAGDRKEMERFFAQNPGIHNRMPHRLNFTDYSDKELLTILGHNIQRKYGDRAELEDGPDGLYARILIRRLGRGRGKEGYGNVRALENVWAQVTQRQADRLDRERKAGRSPDDFLFTKEDLIGPEPIVAKQRSVAWKELHSLIGLRKVKESITSFLERIQRNYHRELQEKVPIEVNLNRIFVGSPGTGKTKVGRLYGSILVDFGLLSKSEVITKNLTDFVGSVPGESEKNTKAILKASEGRVLIIDEAHKLYAGTRVSDPYKTAVINTIVTQVQNTPGEDRCVLLLGYKEQMAEMLENSDQGLARRFPLSSAFQFDDFNDNELRDILEHRLKKQGFEATEEAKNVAIEVLVKARDRPNFGNASEVENLISRAKEKEQMRRGSIDDSSECRDIVFLPQDFGGPAADTSTNELPPGNQQGTTKSVAVIEGRQSVESDPPAGKQQTEPVANSAVVATPAAPENVSVTVTEDKPSVESEPPAGKQPAAKSTVAITEDIHSVEFTAEPPAGEQQAEPVTDELVVKSANIATLADPGGMDFESPVIEAVEFTVVLPAEKQQHADPVANSDVATPAVPYNVNLELEPPVEPESPADRQAEPVVDEPVANSADVATPVAPSNVDIESPADQQAKPVPNSEDVTTPATKVELTAEPPAAEPVVDEPAADSADIAAPAAPDNVNLEPPVEPPADQQAEPVVDEPIGNSTDVETPTAPANVDLEPPVEPPADQQTVDEPVCNSTDVETPAAPGNVDLELPVEPPADQQAEPVSNSADVKTPAAPGNVDLEPPTDQQAEPVFKSEDVTTEEKQSMDFTVKPPADQQAEPVPKSEDVATEENQPMDFTVEPPADRQAEPVYPVPT